MLCNFGKVYNYFFFFCCYSTGSSASIIFRLLPRYICIPIFIIYDMLFRKMFIIYFLINTLNLFPFCPCPTYLLVGYQGIEPSSVIRVLILPYYVIIGTSSSQHSQEGTQRKNCPPMAIEDARV